MLTTTIRSRVEPELKKEAVEILNACGLDLSTAIRLFLHRVVATKGLPFEVVPNEETIAAMQEARKLSARFGSAEELFGELGGTNVGKKGRQGTATGR